MTSSDPAREEHAVRTLDRAIGSGVITPDDASLISKYIRENLDSGHMKQPHANKIAYTLITWRRFIKSPFCELTFDDVQAGISALKAGKNRNGQPFSAHSVFDYVSVLRLFLRWMKEHGFGRMPLHEIGRITGTKRSKIPEIDPGLLSREEVSAIRKVCRTNLERSIIMLMYEAGLRIDEVLTLKWGDLVFSAEGLSVTTRPGKYPARYIRLIMCNHYLRSWICDYPLHKRGSESPLFLNNNEDPFYYGSFYKRIHRLVHRAGITKGVTPAIFRRSRIVHLAEEGMREDVLRAMMHGVPGPDALRPGKDPEKDPGTVCGTDRKKNLEKNPGMDCGTDRGSCRETGTVPCRETCTVTDRETGTVMEQEAGTFPNGRKADVPGWEAGLSREEIDAEVARVYGYMNANEIVRTSHLWPVQYLEDQEYVRTGNTSPSFCDKQGGLSGGST